MKCKICGKSRKISEISRHHRIPQRYRQCGKDSIYARGTAKMCIYCHRILHALEINGFCILPKPKEEKIKNG